MRVGGPIVLGVLGAILYFAVTADVSGISLATVGLIMMIAAGLWFLVELVRGTMGNRSRSTETVQRSDGTVEQRETTTEHRDDPA